MVSAVTDVLVASKTSAMFARPLAAVGMSLSTSREEDTILQPQHKYTDMSGSQRLGPVNPLMQVLRCWGAAADGGATHELVGKQTSQLLAVLCSMYAHQCLRVWQIKLDAM
jgi:hypothetical protein